MQNHFAGAEGAHAVWQGTTGNATAGNGNDAACTTAGPTPSQSVIRRRAPIPMADSGRRAGWDLDGVVAAECEAGGVG